MYIFVTQLLNLPPPPPTNIGTSLCSSVNVHYMLLFRLFDRGVRVQFTKSARDFFLETMLTCCGHLPHPIQWVQGRLG